MPAPLAGAITFDSCRSGRGRPAGRRPRLRHGAATLALAGGADLKIVSAMLRHSSITITADTYTSVLPETARAAAEAAVAIVPRKPRVSRPVTSGPAAPALSSSSTARYRSSTSPSSTSTAGPPVAT